MSQTARFALIFGALLLLVIVGSLLLSRSVERPAPPSATSAAASFPSSPEVDEAVRAFDEGRADEARAALASVAASDPAYPAALLNLSRLELEQGDPAASLEALERLNATRPDDARILSALSSALFRTGDYARAEYFALRALELDPGDPAPRLKLGLYRLAQGRTADAIASYHRAVERSPQEATLFDALAQLEQLAAREPDLAGVHYARAYFAHRLARRETEIEALERFLELEPSGPAADTAREQLAVARSDRFPQGG